MLTPSKTQAPRNKHSYAWIERSGLRDRLLQALAEQRLVQLIAPAGYGKTALLMQAIEALPAGTAVAWLRCDEHDDIISFLNGIAAALEAYDVPWTVAPEALGTMVLEDRRVGRAADTLNDVLARAEVRRGVVVLDDFHKPADPRIGQFLLQWLQGLPAGWSIALSSRKELPLKLARLRVQGLVCDIREADLRFSADEVRRLLVQSPAVPAANDDGLPDLPQRLLRETGGWVAGLCLVLRAGSGTIAGARRAGRRHMFEYLASEVLDTMDPALKHFLLRCSVLAELTPSRCRYVTADSNAGRWLSEIDRNGLFVSVVDEGAGTLKLHDLFRSFLEDRLSIELPEEVPGLLERAAETETDVVRKVELLLRAQQDAAASDALCDAAARLSVGECADLVRAVERLPDRGRLDAAPLSYMQGLLAGNLMLFDPLADHMLAAAEGFERRHRPVLAWRAKASAALARFQLGRFEEAEALLASCRTDPDAMADREVGVLLELYEVCRGLALGPAGAPAEHLSRLTLALEGCDAELWRRCMQSITAHAHRPGYLDALRQFIDAARRVAGDTHFHLRAWVHYYSLATATLIEGNVDAAEALLEAYHEDLDWLGLAVRRRFMFMKSFLSVIQGESEVPEIRALWKEAMTQRPPWPAFIADAAALLARQSANLGDWDHVREVVATVPHNPMFGRATLVRLPPQVLQARLALHDGHAQEAFDLLWPLLPGVDEADRLGNADFVRVTLAAACVRVGRWAEGWDALVPLIEAVRSTGNHGRLMLAGMALLAEIAGSRWPSPMAQDARIDLLRFWVAAAGSRGVSKAVEGGAAPLLRSVPPPVPGSGLSARELEVLALVAQGDSNKLIARKLDLSPHTVKRHVARILDRLQVNSRGAAARWFFDHGR